MTCSSHDAESILDVRTATITRLLALPYNFLKMHEAGSPSTCRPKTAEVERYIENDGWDDLFLCARKTEPVQCKAVIYGSLIHELQQCDLWPSKNDKEIRMSVNNFAKVISDIRISTLPDVITTYPSGPTLLRAFGSRRKD
jgi:hypothetical protein